MFVTLLTHFSMTYAAVAVTYSFVVRQWPTSGHVVITTECKNGVISAKQCEIGALWLCGKMQFRLKN